MRYRVLKDEQQNIVSICEDTIGFIPADPANRDYQEYLAWVAEGNEAEEWNNDSI